MKPVLTPSRRRLGAAREQTGFLAGPIVCGDPFAGLPVEGFLASETAYP